MDTGAVILTTFLSTIPVYLFFATGFYLRHKQVIQADHDAPIMRIAMDVAYPCLVFHSIMKYMVLSGNETLSSVSFSLQAIAAGALELLLGIAAAWLVAKLLRMRIGTGLRTFTLTAGVQNYAFFVIPIIQMLFAAGNDPTLGVWMSRSSLVWGPFSIVWGFAFASVTLLLYRYKDRSDSFLFLTGTFLGGAYEYLCSVLSEIVFGKVFWDYSKMPFNLNGRINLLYCFFWGIATVVWFKRIYPFLSNLIEKLPIAFGTVFTWIIVVFMVLNMFMSLSALIRYDQRDKKIPASNFFERYLDTHYNDQKMKLIYPKAKKVH